MQGSGGADPIPWEARSKNSSCLGGDQENVAGLPPGAQAPPRSQKETTRVSSLSHGGDPTCLSPVPCDRGSFTGSGQVGSGCGEVSQATGCPQLLVNLVTRGSGGLDGQGCAKHLLKTLLVHDSMCNTNPAGPIQSNPTPQLKAAGGWHSPVWGPRDVHLDDRCGLAEEAHR